MKIEKTKFNPPFLILVVALLMPIIVIIAYQFFGYGQEEIIIEEKSETIELVEQTKDNDQEEEEEKFEIILRDDEENLSIEGRILILTIERSRKFVEPQAYLCVGIDSQPVSEETRKALSDRFQIRSVDLSDCSYDAENGYLVHTESGLDAISFNIKDIEEYGDSQYNNQFSYSVYSYLHNLHSGMEELKVRYHYGSFSGREAWVVEEEISLWVS